ncbi:MAG: phosphoribosylaminoimidazolesuccinocarboxamide synthase [Clostridiaceae bacterium]|nr:phosphoribosylaminoimidazolesuccinocarboxamide synthase [Clostridiaceae bacterium]
MKLLYKGKTKDVYELDAETVRLQFKDDVTGKDGIFDPGANEIALSIEGIGKRNLAVSTLFFEKLATNNIPTHFISSDLEAGTMDAKKCTPFGKGIEIIQRKYAVGSFLRRYGLYATEMMPLNNYVEITLKDDKRQDPLITEDGLVALNILTHTQYDSLINQTKQIVDIIDKFLEAKNLQLIDIKLEFGIDTEDNVLLTDEISSGNMRVYRNGEKLEPAELTDLILA